MPDQLDNILKDLYELDPSLRERDGEVRSLVVALLEAKPAAIVPSEAFVARLRQELVAIKGGAVPTGVFVVPLWLRYAAPIGLVATLIFMLAPKPITHLTPLGVPPPSTTPNEAIIPEASLFEATELSDTPVSKMAAPALDMSDPMMESRLMESSPFNGEMINLDSFSVPRGVNNQLIGVDLVIVLEPSILVIQEGRAEGPGLVIGVSESLYERVEDLKIPLSRPLQRGETLYATLYRDNGDGIFTPGKDIPVYDASGTVLVQQLFFID